MLIRVQTEKAMTRIYKNRILILFILIIILLYGCATIPCPVFTRDGKEYGKVANFHGDWDDYYQCGTSYIEGGFYPYAIWAMDHSIAQRYRDQRKARTYGLHFIDDYFPHREKGLVYYLTGDYENALSELELSLSHEASEKAYKIRDEVIKKLMEKESVSKPDFVLISDKSQEPYIFHKESDDSYLIRTKNDPVVISGIAEDEQYVSEIILKDKQFFQDGKPIFLDHSDKKIKFREDLELYQGKFDMKLTARNLRGGERSINLVIHVDRSGPMITLTEYKQDVGIQGWLYDESGIGELIADGKIISVPKEKEVFFTIPLIPDMKITAKDKLGNETETYLHKDNIALISSPILLAQNSETTEAETKTLRVYDPPEIRLQGLCDKQTSFSERISVQGEVNSRSDITELYINNLSVLNRTGTDILFNHSADLNPGENTIEIKASNKSGVSVRKIFVIRKIPEIYKIDYRYRLAVYPFIYTAEISKDLLSSDKFLKEFTDRNRFQIHIREDTEELSEKSHISCHATLVGLVNESVNGVEIVARMVDIQNGEILTIEDSYTESKDRASLELMLERLTEKIHRKFPIIMGVIADITFWGNIIVIFEEEVREKSPFIIYQDKIPECINCSPDNEIIAYECINIGKCGISLNRSPREGDRVILQ